MTTIMTLVYFFALALFIFKTEDMKHSISAIGFPVWMIITTGIGKLLGPVTIVFSKSYLIKNLAYFGLIIMSIHGVTAHLIANDNGFSPSLVALITTILSWIYFEKISKNKKHF